MGPIQSSLNQLTLSILGATAGIAKGLKGGFAPQKQSNEQKEEQKETTNVSDYKVPVGYTNLKNTMYPQKFGEVMSDFAAVSGNDLIAQRARASFKSVEERKASFAQAEELSKKLADMRKKKMGGNK